MNSPFDSIGLEVSGERAFNVLAEQAGTQGEVSRLARRGAVLHGRCWKLGEGLEVWTVLYESKTGEVFYADCRPGFRARFAQRIMPWALTEYDEEGEAIIHGYLHDTDTEILFELQNLTEVGTPNFHAGELHVGLCGLAYEAEICRDAELPIAWQPLEQGSFLTRASHKPDAPRENDWSLRGRVLATKQLRNPLTGSELIWAYLDVHHLKLEVLINPAAMHRNEKSASEVRRGTARNRRRNTNLESLYEPLVAGQMIAVDIWLQGHVLDRRAQLKAYEGVDVSHTPAAAWRHLKRSN
jgi:hypothetical protein